MGFTKRKIRKGGRENWKEAKVEGKATYSVNRDVIILEALASCLLPLAFVSSKIFFHNERGGIIQFVIWA